MDMRSLAFAMLAATLLTGLACTDPETPARRHHEANTPAGKVGQAAHKLSVEADKAGRVVGRQLQHAAHDAHEGWKEADQRDRKHE
jgi:hypothetical protein